MRIAVLSSGGKDSSAAWWWAQCRGWDVVALVTVQIQDGDSHMFQVPSTQWVEHQALAAQVEWYSVNAEGSVDNEISSLETVLEELNLDAIVSGSLRSDFQKVKLENMAHRLGIHSFSPLWHQDPYSHLHGMIENGFKPITKAGVGFVRVYYYEDDKGNKISCHPGVSADYWRNDQTNDGGYHSSLREHLINLK